MVVFEIMKRILSGFAILCSILGAQASFDLNVPVNQAIPDGNTVGLASHVVVSGQSGVVNGLAVSLTIDGRSNGDLYAFLTHGTRIVVLLNRPGRTALDSLGYYDNGFNVTFNDAALLDIHKYGDQGGKLVTGTYQPDGRNVLPNTVLDTSDRTTKLSAFNGMNPNGEWILFVADVSGGDVHGRETKFFI
jgi:subtilisin-like proprotein convertase family protein